MGIRGLTTYINRSNLYLKSYELRDTYLVIDGDNISCQIYILYGNDNCAFGGDYDKYAQLVSDFFDELLKCNVTPLVLLDGGWEHKKLNTIIIRMKQKIKKASLCSPTNQHRMKFIPVLLRRVFTQVMQEKNIRYVQCLLEADNAIASVARVLNCPVLSYDSDFYVFGTSYIPFDMLDVHTVKSSTGSGYMKRCRIYQVESLLSSFQGLSQSMLPLAAVLLGNDYTEHDVFENFFHYLKLSKATSKVYNLQHRIETVFTWLSKYTLSEAIIEILSRVSESMRQKVLSIIEININSYTNASVETLISRLGLPKACVAQVVTPSVHNNFKLNIDIKSLKYIQEIHNEENSQTNDTKEKKEETEVQKIYDQPDFLSIDVLLKNIPEWFINEFHEANYSGSFINLLCQRLYICAVQVEDDNYPSSSTIGLKILSVIFGILKLERDDKTLFMRYITRDRNKGIAVYKLKGINTLSLPNLRKASLVVRRKILDNTLGIANKKCINNLLPEWMLYVGCIKYWIEQREAYKSHKCYLYSLLICMFFNIIDSKIGQHRIMYNFRRKYDRVIQSVQRKRKTENYKPHYSMETTILEAYNEINHDDCLLAAPFFIFHFEMNQQLYSNPNEFDRSIVHAFAEFQICLIHCQDLNALLESPYPKIKFSKLFNGTLLYNLCNNFKKCNNIESYTSRIFQDSPSLFRLFKILLLNMRSLFPSLIL